MTFHEQLVASALQGLLASGHFTYEDEEDGPWFRLVTIEKPDGKRIGRAKIAVVEAALAVADATIRELDGPAPVPDEPLSPSACCCKQPDRTTANREPSNSLETAVVTAQPRNAPPLGSSPEIENPYGTTAVDP